MRRFPRFSSSDRPPPASQYFSNFLSTSYGTRSIMTSRGTKLSCSLFALQHPYNRARPPSFCLLLSILSLSFALFVLIQLRLGLLCRLYPMKKKVKYIHDSKLSSLEETSIDDCSPPSTRLHDRLTFSTSTSRDCYIDLTRLRIECYSTFDYQKSIDDIAGRNRMTVFSFLRCWSECLLRSLYWCVITSM